MPDGMSLDFILNGIEAIWRLKERCDTFDMQIPQAALQEWITVRVIEDAETKEEATEVIQKGSNGGAKMGEKWIYLGIKLTGLQIGWLWAKRNAVAKIVTKLETVIKNMLVLSGMLMELSQYHALYKKVSIVEVNED